MVSTHVNCDVVVVAILAVVAVVTFCNAMLLECYVTLYSLPFIHVHTR